MVLEDMYSLAVISLLTRSHLRSHCSVGRFYLSVCCIFLKRQGIAIKMIYYFYLFFRESLLELLKDSNKCYGQKNLYRIYRRGGIWCRVGLTVGPVCLAWMLSSAHEEEGLWRKA